MSVLKIHMRECNQKSQTYGSEDPTQDHMSAEVLFDIEDENGERLEGVTASVSDPWGTRFEEETFEVGPPIGPEGQYRLPFNHSAFSEGVELYLRKQVGSQASGIRIEGGANVIMRGNRFVSPMTFEIEVSESGAAW